MLKQKKEGRVESEIGRKATKKDKQGKQGMEENKGWRKYNKKTRLNKGYNKFRGTKQG